MSGGDSALSAPKLRCLPRAEAGAKPAPASEPEPCLEAHGLGSGGARGWRAGGGGVRGGRADGAGAPGRAELSARARFSRRLVVGAPTASWLANASVVNPGAVYRCRIGRNPRRTCEQLQLGELGLGLGVSDPSRLVDPTGGQTLEKVVTRFFLKSRLFPFLSMFLSLLLVT